MLPVVTRELIVSSRRRGTYHTRVGAAGLALLAMLWLMLVSSLGTGTAVLEKMLFDTLSGIAFAYCLLVGVRVTADCLSAEKREGTLGLLFLTDLRGYDLVLGKLVSSSLASVYGLLATVPVLSLALLLGGVSLSQVFLVAMVLFNTMFFSLSAGILVSTMSQNERKAAFATLMLILFCTLFPVVVLFFIHEFLEYDFPDEASAWGMLPSPLLGFLMTFKTGPLSLAPFPIWVPIGVIHFLSWLFLAIASRMLPRLAHDRPQSKRTERWTARFRTWSYGEGEERLRFRRRLLDLNPFTWLSSRERFKAYYVWFFLGVLLLMWGIAAWKYPDIFFVWDISPGALWLLHGFVKIWFASEVCQRLIEDRRAGALELLLSTPLGVQEISHGQSLALRRQFKGPVIALLSVDCTTAVVGMMIPGPVMTTNDQMARLLVFPAGMIVMLLDLWAIQWVGMWKSLTSTSLNRVLLTTYGRILILPWLLFFLFGSGMAAFQFLTGVTMRMSSVTLVIAWTIFSVIVDLVHIFPSRKKFMEQFRTLAASRFDSPVIQPGVTSRLGFLGTLFTRSTTAEPRGNLFVVLRRHWTMTSIGLVLVIAVVSLAVYRASLRSELKRELAAISARGEPAFPEEIDRWDPPIPEAQNAMDRLTPLLTMRYIGTITNQEALVAKHAAALEEVHRSLQLSGSRMEINWDNPNNFQNYQQLHNLSELAQVLNAQASVRQRTNDIDGALDSIAAIARIGRIFGGIPIPIAQHFRLACVNIGLDASEQLIANGTVPKPQLNRLMRILRESEAQTLDGNWRVRAFIGHRYLTIRIHENPGQRFNPWMGGPPPPAIQLLAGIQTSLGMSDRALIKALRSLNAQIDALKHPFPENLRQLQTIQGQLGPDLGANPFGNWLASMTMIDPGALSWEMNLVNRTRLTEIAVAIELARLETEAVPEDLQSLAPTFIEALPVPLGDGGPFTFERLNPGYRIFHGTNAPVVKANKGRNNFQTSSSAAVITVRR